MIKSLWATVQGDPVFMRKVNGWLTVFWIVMIPISIATGWVSSVVYVSACRCGRSCPVTSAPGRQLV